MKLKRLSKIFLLASSLSLMIGCANTEKVGEAEEKYKVGLVLSVGGVNDESFNQSAWEGALRAEEEYENVEVTYLESNGEADYTPNIETLIDMDMDLIVGVGFQVADSVKEAAETYPNQSFAMIDSSYDEGEEIPNNVRPILFNEEQAGYLTGLIAGKMTKTNTIAWIGGFDIPSCTPFYTGYEKGAKEANPNVKVLKQYINSFTDAAKGKVAAQQMIANGSDIIFMATGGGNMGIIEAIKEANGVKGIGVDMPMSYLAKDYIITSALKNVGEGLKLTIKDYIEGNFNGGNEVKYDLSNGGVGYEITDHLSQDLIKYVDSKINK
jgi:basic membrane protein A